MYGYPIVDDTHPRAMHGCQVNGKQLQGTVYAIRKVMEIMIKHIIYNWSAFSPLGRALKNYRYFHFIGVVRRHYRAFTRRSGYDVW